MTRKTLLAASILVLGAMAAPVTPASAEVPRELKWSDLVPRTATAAKKQLKPFFAKPAGATADGANSPSGAKGNSPYLDSYDIRTRPEDAVGAPPPRIPEGKFMSRPVLRKDGVNAELKTELDGQTVKIGGYVVPLDFKATKITEFLLVPFVGACIHVPPPPANQIVYVKSKKGFTVKGEFDPVYVTGKMSAKITPTGLAETGYTIDADAVEMRAK